MNKLFIIFALIIGFGFIACEDATDISDKMDHKVPSYELLTDSIVTNPGETIEIKVKVEDEGGLRKMQLVYGNWNVREVHDLMELDYPTSYLFETTVTIPEDVEKEWEEDFQYNDGTSTKITQQYHKFEFAATDKSYNVRNVIIYVKVQ